MSFKLPTKIVFLFVLVLSASINAEEVSKEDIKEGFAFSNDF
jgi:hypothetical protein